MYKRQALARLGLDGSVPGGLDVPRPAPAARYEPRMDAGRAAGLLARFAEAADRAVAVAESTGP